MAASGARNAPPSGKGIGRDVHHAHDEGKIKRQREPAAAENRAQLAAGAVAPAVPSVDGGGIGPGATGTFGWRGGLPAMMSFS